MQVLWVLGPAACAAVLAAPLAARAEPAPALVELFTSQGCSSCPPADALLGEVARRPGVLALAYHVDYWDRLGWKDPFSSPAATQLQRDYSARLGVQTYTPQAVVNGAAADIGSDRAAVDGMLHATRPAAAMPGSIARSGTAFRYMLAGPVRGEMVLVTYDPMHTTVIGRGENGGRTLVDVNAVRSRRVVQLRSQGGEVAALPDEVGQRYALLALTAEQTRVVAIDRP